jgi:hypothetical protein
VWTVGRENLYKAKAKEGHFYTQPLSSKMQSRKNIDVVRSEPIVEAATPTVAVSFMEFNRNDRITIQIMAKAATIVPKACDILGISLR